jgi:hypothetical protein
MRKRVHPGFAIILGVALIAVASPAHALTFDFSYSALDGSFSGQGDFITGSTSSPYLVTGVTGTAINGNASSVIAGTSTFASADNLLFFPTQPYIDFFGISFATVGSGAFNLYFNNVEFNGYGVLRQSSDPTGMSAGTEVRLNVSATPLPASLPLFAGGLAAIGLLLWRRRRNSATATAICEQRPYEIQCA